MQDSTPHSPALPAAPAQNPPAHVYYPSEVLAIVDAALAKQQRPLVSVRGAYRRRGKQAFNGYFYDAISDVQSDQELTVRVPVNLREAVRDGDEVEAAGVLLRKIDTKGFIQVTVSVTRLCKAAPGSRPITVIPQDSLKEQKDASNRRIMEAKREAGYKEVDRAILLKLISGAKPKVTIIYAAVSIADSDFKAGLGDAAGSYKIREERCNFAEAPQLVSALERADRSGSDIVCVVRGGGQGLDAVDDAPVLSAALSMDTPLVCALGHVEDRLVFKEISDKACSTPNGLGSWLRGLKIDAERAIIRAANMKNPEDPEKVQLKGLLKESEKKYDELCKETNSALREARDRAAMLEGEIEVLRKQSGEQHATSTEDKDTGVLWRENETMREENRRLRKKVDELSSKDDPNSGFKNRVIWTLISVVVVLIILLIYTARELKF